jgi:hypothetical protein
MRNFGDLGGKGDMTEDLMPAISALAGLTWLALRLLSLL